MIPGLDIILGGVTGLLGNVITGWLKYKNQKMEFDHQAKMVALETAAMREEAKMQIAITKAEIEGAVELADAQAYMESLKDGNKPMFSEKWIDRLFNVQGWVRFFSIPMAVLISVGFALVDWLRGFMRPALTMYLTGMSSVVTWMAWKIMQENNIQISAAQAFALYNETTSIVIYLTVSCVTWWFGDRTMSKAIIQMRQDNSKKGTK